MLARWECESRSGWWYPLTVSHWESHYPTITSKWDPWTQHHNITVRDESVNVDQFGGTESQWESHCCTITLGGKSRLTLSHWVSHPMSLCWLTPGCVSTQELCFQFSASVTCLLNREREWPQLAINPVFSTNVTWGWSLSEAGGLSNQQKDGWQDISLSGRDRHPWITLCSSCTILEVEEAL